MMLDGRMLSLMRNEQIAAYLGIPEGGPTGPVGLVGSYSHYGLVKSVGYAFLACPPAIILAGGGYRFALTVADTMDSLGNVSLALEQDAHDAWDAEARDLETAFEGEIPMTTYRVETLITEHEDGSQEWALAARWPMPGEARQMSYSPASGLTCEQAEHTARMINATAGVADGMSRILKEDA